MRVTFLIGNGFDINCGMKCTYQDIYKGYVENRSGEPEIIRAFKDDILQKPQTWADFEEAMNLYLSRFKSEDEFIRVIRDFKSYMIGYLKNEEANLLARIDKLHGKFGYNVTNEVSRSLEHFYDDISHNVSKVLEGRMKGEHIYYNIISFNYTKTVDSLLSRCGLAGVIHIHGMLEDDPVLGMDQKEQLNDEMQFIPTKRFCKEFLKPFFNQIYDMYRVTEAKEAISKSDVICVYGLSFGESDLTWRNMIVEWLKSSGHHLFLYDYEYSCKTVFTAFDKIDYEDEAKEKFLNRIGVDENTKNQIIDSLHIRVGGNLFNIATVLDESEREQKEAEEKEKKQQELRKSIADGSAPGIVPIN